MPFVDLDEALQDIGYSAELDRRAALSIDRRRWTGRSKPRWNRAIQKRALIVLVDSLESCESAH